MKLKSTRRDFLDMAIKGLGVTAMAPILYETVLNQIVQEAFADDQAAAAAFNYIAFTFPGGPPRWMFDLPLTPHGSTDSFVAGGFGTRYETVAGGKMAPFYSTDKFRVNGRDLYLAPVWGMNTKKQNFSSLLPDTLFVRGMDMEINSHPLSAQRQLAPIIGGASLAGVVADNSNAPIPTLADTGTSATISYRSNKRLSYLGINYNESTDGNTANPVRTILTPFSDYRTSRVAQNAARLKLGEQALEKFEEMAKSRGIASSSLPLSYTKAMSLIDAKILSLADTWVATVGKYRAIMNEAMMPTKGSLPGLFDKAIKTDKADFRFRYSQENGRVLNFTDMRDMIGANVLSRRMAENFAIAEILLEKGSSSFIFSVGTLDNYMVAPGVMVSPGLATHDQHFYGNMLGTMVNTLMYRAFLGCMTEFRSALIAKDQWKRTIVHINAEFNRTPQTTGFGADHGYMAGNATLMSGMIDGGRVVGNVRAASLNDSYKGTFGVGETFVLGGLTRPIQVNDVALTVTSMTAAANIVTNGRSLLVPTSGGKWSVAKDEAKNV